MITAEQLVSMTPTELKDAVVREAAAMYWQRVWDAQDDVLFNGTNGASDESREFLGLKRTYSQ